MNRKSAKNFAKNFFIAFLLKKFFSQFASEGRGYVGVKIEFQENWNFPGNFIKGEIPS